MKSNDTWIKPGWPWELELLTLVFVLVAMWVPFYLRHVEETGIENLSLIERATQSHNPTAEALKGQNDLIWLAAIIGLYFVHIIIGSANINLVSTPFTHLGAPLLFALIAYYRLYILNLSMGRTITIVTGSGLQIVLWSLAAIIITLLLARVRMARHLLTFKDTKWDMSMPTRLDISFFQLLIHVQPLLYMPRQYRACDKGILIEGWFYLATIPFDSIRSITQIGRSTISTSGHYFATSVHTLIRLERQNDPIPFFLSPQDRDTFFKYCSHHLARLQHSATAQEIQTT